MAVENVAGSEPSIRGERNAACRINGSNQGSDKSPGRLVSEAVQRLELADLEPAPRFSDRGKSNIYLSNLGGGIRRQRPQLPYERRFADERAGAN